MKTLITFVHFETESSKRNLDFFLQLGLTNSSDHQFNFVINSSTGGTQIPCQSNISIIKGHNKGYDFGGYQQSLESVKLDQFDRFIFINDTCRGPFLPDYIPNSLNWVDLLNSCINDKVKLVGSTWNFRGLCSQPNLHIQSYCFATDFSGLEVLLNKGIFDSIGKDKSEVIIQHEIRMSRVLLAVGFKIKPLQLSQYNSEKHGDICFNERYYGATLNPLEVMFVKTNRIQNKIIENYTIWKIQETKK